MTGRIVAGLLLLLLVATLPIPSSAKPDKALLYQGRWTAEEYLGVLTTNVARTWGRSEQLWPGFDMSRHILAVRMVIGDWLIDVNGKRRLTAEEGEAIFGDMPLKIGARKQIELDGRPGFALDISGPQETGAMFSDGDQTVSTQLWEITRKVLIERMGSPIFASRASRHDLFNGRISGRVSAIHDEDALALFPHFQELFFRRQRIELLILDALVEPENRGKHLAFAKYDYARLADDFPDEVGRIWRNGMVNGTDDYLQLRFAIVSLSETPGDAEAQTLREFLRRIRRGSHAVFGVSAYEYSSAVVLGTISAGFLNDQLGIDWKEPAMQGIPPISTLFRKPDSFPELSAEEAKAEDELIARLRDDALSAPYPDVLTHWNNVIVQGNAFVEAWRSAPDDKTYLALAGIPEHDYSEFRFLRDVRLGGDELLFLAFGQNGESRFAVDTRLPGCGNGRVLAFEPVENDYLVRGAAPMTHEGRNFLCQENIPFLLDYR